MKSHFVKKNTIIHNGVINICTVVHSNHVVMDVLNYSLSIFVTNLLYFVKGLQYLFDGRMGSSARFPSKDIKNMQYELYGPI